MRIKSIRIQNLRAYSDQTINLDDYTCLVGANGAGKSTILCALNIFFRENESSSTNLVNLDREDFHKGDTSKPIEITVEFVDLSDDAQRDFAEYYRHGTLIVSARADYDPVSGAALVRQYGNRLGMQEFTEFFRRNGDGAKVDELRKIYEDICSRFSGLPANAKTKPAMIEALRAYESTRPEQCSLLPSEDQFYGATQGQGILRNYIQWVYVPAVKDAAGEQAEAKNTALGRLLARTVRSQVNFSERLAELRSKTEEVYREILDQQQGALDSISEDLQARMAEWSNPDATARLQWQQDPKSSIRIEEPVARLLAGDGEFEGSIARFGHGMQRSYIIALLQGLSIADDAGPRLILGIEEPELYQHPPQARYLSTVLQKLSRRNAQIISSTHSPYFIDGLSFERIRLIRKMRHEGNAVVKACSFQTLSTRLSVVTGQTPMATTGVMAKLHQTMQPTLNEMFFTPKLVLVEGLEDQAYINSWLIISGRWEKFRARGGHVVQVGSKSELVRPLIIAQELGIPTFVVFDCDADKIRDAKPEKQHQIKSEHQRDNAALFQLAGLVGQEAFPATPVWTDTLAAWPDDMAKLIEVEVGSHWARAGDVASAAYGSAANLKKHAVHIAARLAEFSRLSVPVPTLERLCDAIVRFADQP